MNGCTSGAPSPQPANSKAKSAGARVRSRFRSDCRTSGSFLQSESHYAHAFVPGPDNNAILQLATAEKPVISEPAKYDSENDALLHAFHPMLLSVFYYFWFYPNKLPRSPHCGVTLKCIR